MYGRYVITKTFILVSLLVGCQVQGDAQIPPLINTQTMVNDALYSTVSIVKASDEGLVGPTCTAFYISPRILATANHCVKPAVTGTVQVSVGLSIQIPDKNVGPELGREILIVDYESHNNFINDRSANPMITVRRTTVVGYNTIRDVAILKLSDGEPPSQHFFRVSRFLPRVGNRIYEIGMPARQFWLFTQGIVSSVRRYPDGHVEIIHQAEVTHGASGGPVFNDSGEIVGITTAFIRGANYIGYATTSLDLIKLVEMYNTEQHENNNLCMLSSCVIP